MMRMLAHDSARRIGITGARGFIGSWLVRRLMERGAGSLRLLVRNAGAVGGDELPAGVEVRSGDLLSPGDCDAFVAGLSVIFYLAHRNTPVSSDRDLPSDALLSGVPLLNLLQSICGRGDCPHVVYFSSGGAMYARSTRGIPYVETDPCAPSTSYGIQKAMAEQYLRMAAERGRLTATVLRIGNAYGDLLPAERMQGLIGVAINNVLQGRPVVLFGNPQNVRDYVHLDDICDVAERVMRPLQPFAIFNVGTQRGHTVHQVLDAIDRCTGLSMERQCSTDPCVGAWLPDWCVLDVSKAASVLGWTPKVSLRVGIERMLHAHAPRLGRAS